VTGSDDCGVLYDRGEAVEPEGIYAVALVNVTNHGLRSDEVGRHNSLWVQDDAGRLFDLARLDVHQAAEDTYGRKSLYYAIQPGFTVPMVFVFDVLPESRGLHLVSVTH